MRKIAGAAGVNIALVNRYFGSKEALFEEAFGELLDVRRLTDHPREQFGESLVDFLTADDPDHLNPLPMLLLASADPTSREIAYRLLAGKIIKPLKTWFDGPLAEQRAIRIVLIASGFFLYRLIYPMPAPEGRLAPETRKWLSQTFQSTLDSSE